MNDLYTFICMGQDDKKERLLYNSSRFILFTLIRLHILHKQTLIDLSKRSDYYIFNE